MKSITPESIAAPFARYAHGVVVPEGRALLFASGQLGLGLDGDVPSGAEKQADLCFDNIDAILSEAGGGRGDVVRINAYVSDRDHMQGYMISRDRWLADVSDLPASTLMIVSGFTRPEFLVEIEIVAAVRAS